MSEIKTKIRTYNDIIDLFGEEKAADMLSEALDWSTIDPKNDKKNIMECKPLLLDPYMTYEGEDYCKHIVAGLLDAVACMDSRYMSGHTVDTGHAFIVSPGTYEPYIGIHDPVYGAGYMMVDLDKPFEIPMNRIWIAMDDYSGPETKEGLRGMYHSPQDVSAFSDPFCGSVSVTPTRDEKQEPAKSGLEAKRDACALSAAHLDSPNTEIPNGKNMERE